MWKMLAGLGLSVLLVTGGSVAAQQDKAPLTGKEQQDQNMHGKIVRVNPDTDTVIVRVGEGATAKEMEYKVNKTSKFWGTDRQPLTEGGLRNKAFREGADVWFRPGTGADNRTLSELRFFNPGAGGTNPNPGKE